MNTAQNGQRIERFIKAVKEAVGDFIICLSHVDPDAIGAGVCMKAIIGQVVGEKSKVKIFYCGSVGLKQNRIIMNKYGLDQLLKPMEEYKPCDNDNLIMVDSSPRDTRFGDALKNRKPLIVIDHHLRGESLEDEKQFFWLEQIGSACTQVTELATHEKINLNFEDESSAFIAMLLAIGIYTDTRNLVTSSYRDLEAYAKVKKAVDDKEFAELIEYDLPESYYINSGRAFSNKKMKGAVLVAGIGIVQSKEGDDIVPIANALIRMEGVDTAYVWCIIGDATVRISARSTDLSKTADDLLGTHFRGESVGGKLTPIKEFEGGGMIRLDLGSFGKIMSLVSADDNVRKAKEALVDAVLTSLLLESQQPAVTE